MSERKKVSDGWLFNAELFGRLLLLALFPLLLILAGIQWLVERYL